MAARQEQSGTGNFMVVQEQGHGEVLLGGLCATEGRPCSSWGQAVAPRHTTRSRLLASRPIVGPRVFSRFSELFCKISS